MDYNLRIPKSIKYLKEDQQKTKRRTKQTQAQFTIFHISDERLRSMRSQQTFVGYVLTPLQRMVREQLFSILILVGRHPFDLKIRTIELSMRIFDYYCFKSLRPFTKKSKNHKYLPQGSGNILSLDSIDQGKLTLSACIFMCSKYNQIYPPNLNDILYFGDEKFTKKQVISKEIEIVTTIDFFFQISLINEWYEVLFNLQLPMMALDYYAQQTIFNAQNFAIAFAFTYFMDKQKDLMSQTPQIQRFKSVIEQIDEYKKKVYQNDK